jgi:ribosome modulation factor
MAGKLMDDADGAPGGDVASNLTPESFLEVFREWREVRREQSASATAVARVGKRMKSIGIDKQAFDMFEKLSDMDPDDAVNLLKTVMRYGKWANRQFATQQDLFRGMAVEVPKETARADFHEFEIEDQGYVAGFEGRKIEENPHPHEEADNPNYAIWRKGWHKGQEARVHKAFGGDDTASGGTGEVKAATGAKGRGRKAKGARGG